MHVVLVADHASINGGQAKVAIDSALGLVARGVRVTFFAAVGPIDPRLEPAGIRVVCLGHDDVTTAKSKLAFAAQAIWNGRAARALAAELAFLDPRETVVHVHAFAKSLSPSIGVALRRSGLPVLYTMHEFFLVCPNGGFYDYPAAQICHRTPMSAACLTTNCDAQSYPRKLARVARHVGLSHVARLPELFRHVVTISDLQERVVAPLLPRGTTFHRVDNPISVPNEPVHTGKREHFLFVGRVSKEKGAPVFAEAARLAGARPVFVGDGEQRAELAERYPEAVMLGWRDAHSVQALMRKARALVFPSVWYEGQPLTVFEALACGTAVVVSDACAGREAVEAGETGFWFRSGDANALAAHLRRLEDDGLAERLGRAAHARFWAAPLSLDAHLDRLGAVYETVLREATHGQGSARARTGGPAIAAA